MQITAAVTNARSAPFELEALELDAPRDDEVLVRIAGVGICHTDLLARDQAYPMPLPAVLGHEGAGVVERVGAAVTKVAPGDHVVLTFRSCGSCRNCLQGRRGYCERIFALTYGGTRPDGSGTLSRDDGGAINGCFFGQSSFATHALAHESNTVKVPRDVPLEILGPLGCGIQTGVSAVTHALAVRPGATLAVFGTGPVGLSAVMGARLVGCGAIVAVDVKAPRLVLARELGATHTIDAASNDVADALADAFPDGLHYALDTTGRPDTVRTAADALAPLGVLGLIGGSPLGTELRLDMNHMLFGGRTVRGIIGGGDAVTELLIPELIEHYREGRLPFDRLVSVVDLEHINEAVADAEAGEVVKPVLRPT